MEAWKKGAFVGGLWGFISWFGLGVAMSEIYLPINFNRIRYMLKHLVGEIVKLTLFLPSFLVVRILKISRETDPVTAAFQNIALFPAVLLVGIISGSIIFISIEKFRTWRQRH